MPIISVTRLRLRKLRYMVPFLWHAIRSNVQARQADGNQGVMLRNDGNVYWTMTLWRDDAALRAFMLHGPHRAAMPHLSTWCDEASLVRWESDDGVLPSWESAAQRLAADGRVSTLRFPSAAHAAGNTLGSPQ